MLQNIRNNWTTEKTQTLERKDNDSEETAKVQETDFELVNKEEIESFLKAMKLDYRFL